MNKGQVKGLGKMKTELEKLYTLTKEKIDESKDEKVEAMIPEFIKAKALPVLPLLHSKQLEIDMALDAGRGEFEVLHADSKQMLESSKKISSSLESYLAEALAHLAE